MKFLKPLIVSGAAVFLTAGCIDLKSSNNISPEVPEDPAPTPEPEPIPGAVTGSLSIGSTKQFVINWTDVEGADYYRLLENPDGVLDTRRSALISLPGKSLYP